MTRWLSRDSTLRRDPGNTTAQPSEAGTASDHVRWAGRRRIGPIGTIFRVLVAMFLLQRLLFTDTALSWWHYPLGLIGFPAVLVAAQAAYARWRPRQSPWIGPFAVATVCGVVLLGYLSAHTRPALGLMIVMLLVLAAIAGDPDCEGTVIGNLVLRRSDRIACPNSIVDALERHLRRRSFAAVTDAPDAASHR